MPGLHNWRTGQVAGSSSSVFGLHLGPWALQKTLTCPVALLSGARPGYLPSLLLSLVAGYALSLRLDCQSHSQKGNSSRSILQAVGMGAIRSMLVSAVLNFCV